MPSIISIKKTLLATYPQFLLLEDKDFFWSPNDKTIAYSPQDSQAVERLLHEYSHAILGHVSYARDIELIEHERDAWNHAKTVLAPQLGTEISAYIVENDLDTYRDWLHARSACPHCSSTGLQTSTRGYTCVACRGKWTVNDARICALRRYKM